MKLPVTYPSIPDRQSGPTKYNEPVVPVKPDRLPSSTLKHSGGSKAELRLRIEQFLSCKEDLPQEALMNLGEEARGLMIELLDDEMIRSHPAVHQRLISALGQLSVKRSIAPLSNILSDTSESNLTRAYAANALGRIGDLTALQGLGAAVNIKDDMVRRQVAIALERIDSDAVLPYLIKLQRDKSPAVSEVAARGIQRWEKNLGQRLGAKPAKPRSKKLPKRKLRPAADQA